MDTSQNSAKGEPPLSRQGIESLRKRNERLITKNVCSAKRQKVRSPIIFKEDFNMKVKISVFFIFSEFFHLREGAEVARRSKFSFLIRNN